MLRQLPALLVLQEVTRLMMSRKHKAKLLKPPRMQIMLLQILREVQLMQVLKTKAIVKL